MDMSEVLSFDEDLPVAPTEDASNLKKMACEKLPLLEYAVHNIFYHADGAEEHGISQETFLEEMKGAIPSFGDPSHGFVVQSWFEHYIHLSSLLERYEVRRYTSDITILYFMADNGLSNLIPIQLEKTPDIGKAGRVVRCFV